MCYLSILNLQDNFNNDDEEDKFTSAGNAGSFVKKGVKKDQSTGEIVGWSDFYRQIQSNSSIPHNSQVDEATLS